MPSLREYLKPLQVSQGKWVLPIWNHHRFDIMPVDDPGSCGGQHILCYGQYHRYQNEGGALYVTRCPERLSWNEKQSLIQDDPPGSWEGKLAVKKIEMLQQEARKKRERQEEEKAGMRGNR